jgi:hypothetical protein
MSLFSFKSTNFFKAFLLYALVGSLIASLAIHIRLSFDKDEYGIRKWIAETFGLEAELESDNSLLRLVFAFILTFFITFFIYHFMYFLLGWGGGMLVPLKGPGSKAQYFKP